MVRRHRVAVDEAPSAAIISVVAEKEDCSPLALTPLAEAVDPEALDALLAQDSGPDRVTFRYCGYEVTASVEEIVVKAEREEFGAGSGGH